MSAELKEVRTAVAVKGDALVETVAAALDQLIMQGFTKVEACGIRGNDDHGFLVQLEGVRQPVGDVTERFPEPR